MQVFPSAEAPGLSAFYKNADGDVFHTYSTYGRGLEPLVGTYMILDLAPTLNFDCLHLYGMK